MTARILWACVLAALLAPAIAEAHRSSTSRVHNIRHIAESQYGAGKCQVSATDATPVRPMEVPIIRRADGIRNPRGQLTGWSAAFNFQSVTGLLADPPFWGCSIDVDGREGHSSEGLCRLIGGHEFGHGNGLPHVNDPRNIMNAHGLPFWEPCAYGMASTRSTRPLPQPLDAPAANPEPPVVGSPPQKPTPVTVILLHGGGWRSGHPNGMEPQARDLRAHGINARSIPYPLGSVARALEHVRQVAAAESGPVVLYGISAGGTLAAALAASGDVAGAINVSGPTDFKHWVTPSGLELKYRLRMSPAEQRAVSPLWRLSGRQTAQLLQCGLADPLVDYISQCQRYADAARRGNPDTTLQQTVAHGQSFDDHARARSWIQARWPR